MTTQKLLLLPGDGIGPEVMAEVKKLIAWMNAHRLGSFETEEGLVGGAAYDADKVAVTDATMAMARQADAVIFGAVGGPKWDSVPFEVRPEAGLLRLRKELGLFANLRPAICYPALAESSSLKREVVDGLDIMIVRELTGGVYFGEPKIITDLGNGQKRAVDTQVYDTYEIERIARVGFELARRRRNKLTSMEKRNVMKTGVLWHEVVNQVHAREFADVQLEHQLGGRRGDAAGALAQAVRRDRHRQSVRRRALGCGGDADRFAGHACRRPRSARWTPKPRSGGRCTSRSTAPPPISPARGWRTRSPCWVLRHGAALFVRDGQGSGFDRPGDRGDAGQGPSDQRHPVGGDDVVGTSAMGDAVIGEIERLAG